jgi:multiple antibiotic resistance protein
VSLFQIALTFFLVTNPIGNSPAIVALVKDFEFERQKRILIREGLIALLIALFFQYFGEVFLGVLQVQDFAVSITGGTLLFLVALGMIFSSGSSDTTKKQKQEPFIVPIATPILSGPGLMAIIMLYSRQEENNLKITSAILLAWIFVLAVVAAAPYLQRFLGKRGLVALEQLMGMILAMMSAGMILNGIRLFVEYFKHS